MSYHISKKQELLLSLGSNLGDRKSQIDKALILLEDNLGEVIARSPFYESKAWGFESNSNFLNICAKTKSEFSPERILEIIQDIELKLGRIRKKKVGYNDRSIDIDILFYGNLIVNSKFLKIPHPLIYDRNFVLKPLFDIAPKLIDPNTGKGLRELLKSCNDQSSLLLYEK